MLFILAMMWSCSFLGDRKKKQYIPVEVDLTNEVGKFEGLGANVPISFFSRRMKALQTFNDLNIKYIRVKREAENWDDILALRSSTSRLGIKWIYSIDEIPPTFLNEYGRLSDVRGFAGWWAEEVDELLYQDVPADFIELLDTPDLTGGDSLSLSSDLYNKLIHATREELDLRDFQDVSIIGPGLSSPDISGDLETWYMGLDQVAFEMLPYWSVHTWEEVSKGEGVGLRLTNLLDYLDQIDSRKPIFASSYATSQSTFADQVYPDPDQYDVLGNLNTFETYYYSATFTMPYALRVYSNTLNLLKHKQVIPFLYQLYDAPADVKYKKKSWGLLDLNGVAKPVFTLLSQLMKRVPDKAILIPGAEISELDLNVLTFKSSQQVSVTIINESISEKSLQVSLSGAGRSLEFKSAITCFAPELFPVELGKRDDVEVEELELKVKYDSDNDAYSFHLTMQPQSTFVGEFLYK